MIFFSKVHLWPDLVILAGDASVGKTHLVHRFVKNNNEDTKNIPPTIGVEFGTRIVQTSDSRKIKTQIWDTGKYSVI